jgi:hypothetical protein
LYFLEGGNLMIKVNNLDFSALRFCCFCCILSIIKRKKSRQQKSKTTDSFGSFMSGIFSLLRLWKFLFFIHSHVSWNEKRKERNAAKIILIKVPASCVKMREHLSGYLKKHSNHFAFSRLTKVKSELSKYLIGFF